MSAKRMLAKTKCLRNAFSSGQSFIHESETKSYEITQGRCLSTSPFLTAKHEAWKEKMHDSEPITSHKKQKISKHWYQTSSQPWKNEEELVHLICKSVIFENENVIAFNKPNGLPMLGLNLQNTKQVTVSDQNQAVSEQLSMKSVIPEVQRRLNLGKYLKPVYNTNRNHSGVTVYTKKPEIYDRLRKYFLSTICQKRIYQSFKVIILGSLELMQGKDQILLKKSSYSGHSLGELVKTAGKRNSNVTKCSFEYKSICSNEDLDCSLIDIMPVSVRNDSLNVFLSNKLSPILGDHIYGNLVGKFMNKKILLELSKHVPSPQNIPVDIQKKLSLKADMVDIVPLHVHCESVHLPIGSLKKEMTSIHAPLPEFFCKTIRCLSLDEHYDDALQASGALPS